MATPDMERCAVVTIAIADYDETARNAQAVADAGDAFASLFDRPDGRPENIAMNRRLVPRAEEASVRAEIRTWGSSDAEIGLLLWTGHCERDALGQAHVRVSDARVAAATLADWLTGERFRRWVVIVDGCFAESVITTLYPLLDRAAAGPDQSCVLLASADSTTAAEAGRFTSALAKVLAEGPEHGWWSTTDRFLAVGNVIDRLDAELVRVDPTAVGTVPKTGGRRWSGRVFPNPRYRPLSAAVALDEEHFLPKARGIETGESGWYFTGRTQVLGRIVDWLAQSGNGMFIVTGPAGTGKSAVLGRIVTLSVPEYRRLAGHAGVLALAPAGTVPPEGVVTAAFHARLKRLDQLLVFLGYALNLGDVEHVGQLAEGLRVRNQPVVIAVDALDEAAAGHATRMIDEVLAPLASMEGVKILIGTRPGVARWADEMNAPLAGFADLSLEPDTKADIETYSAERLLRLASSSYANDPVLASVVAEGVAARALSDPTADGRRVGSFLVARLLTKTLASQPPLVTDPGWQRRLPSDFAEAFEADLDNYASRLGPAAELTIRDMLEGLAWDEGSGLPRVLIPVMTEAVTGHTSSDRDVAMLLREAAGHLVEAEHQGWAVYSLYHERFREHLRAVTRGREGVGDKANATIHARIVDALIDWGADTGWTDVDPYLAGALPRHARLGGRIERLVLADGFLEHADPGSMLDAIPLTGTNTAGARIRTYRRASHILGSLHPDERRLALELAAALAGEAEPRLVQGPVSARWAGGPRVSALQTFTGHTGSVDALAIGVVEGRVVAVTGGADKTVRVWDLSRGAAVGEPLLIHAVPEAVATGAMDGQAAIIAADSLGVWDLARGALIGEPFYTGPVRAVATGVVDGRAVAVTGGKDRTARVWDLVTGAPIGKPLKGHTDEVGAVAIEVVEGRAVAVTGSDDKTVRVWDLVTGAPIGKPLKGHADRVWAVATAVVDGRALAVSGGDGLRVWDLATGTPAGKPLKGNAGYVRAVATGVVDGRAVVVSGGHELRVWDLASGKPIGERLESFRGSVHAVAIGMPDGQPMAVSCGGDEAVRVWDLANGAVFRKAGPADNHPVLAVAAGAVQGRAVAVSGSYDRTLRLWDLNSGAPIGKALNGHRHFVAAVATAVVGGRAVAVSGSYDRTLRVWDLATGITIGKALKGHTGAVLAVAIAVVGGRAVAVSGSADHTLRVWDLDSGMTIGEALTGHTEAVEAVAAGAFGDLAVAVSGSADHTLRVWDLETRAPIGKALTGHTDLVKAVAAGIVGGRVVAVSGSYDRTLRVWDLESGAPIGKALTGHTAELQTVAIGAVAGRAVAISGSQDQTVRVWDLASSATTLTLPTFDTADAVETISGGLLIGTGSNVLCVNIAGLETIESGTKTAADIWHPTRPSGRAHRALLRLRP